MRKVVSKGEIKKARFIKEIFDLEVRKAPTLEGIELEPYIVRVNGAEEQFQYNNGKFYLDEKNSALCMEQMEEHKKVVKVMEDEGKTEEEIKEYMKGKGTDFVDRVEWIIDCEGLHAKVESLISHL